MNIRSMGPPVCVILAGGQGTRLNALAWNRAKPAVPFAGIYRLIDFTISNAANSGIERIGVLTQYLPLSLMDHIGDGSSWDLNGRQRQIKILPPQQGVNAKDWYLGTAHAVFRNIDFISYGGEKEVLILSGDHIYGMNYQSMIQFHRNKRAHLTIAVMPVSEEEASRFGIAVVDSDSRIIAFQEKPQKPRSRLGSMGIYIANTDFLIDQLKMLVSAGGSDIGGDLIPLIVNKYKIYAFQFTGYWRDVGTLRSYWECSMDVLKPQDSGLDLKEWDVRTNLIESGLHERAPSFIKKGANVINSFISPGCHLEGYIYGSVLSPGVRIEKNAIVKNSILFHDAVVKSNAHLENVIADKNVIIGRGVEIGLNHTNVPNKEFPDHLNKGITLLGKNAQIMDQVKIGRNSLVFPECCVEESSSNKFPEGTTFYPE